MLLRKLSPFLIFIFSLSRPAVAGADDSAPWRPLFNGQDLTGWTIVDPPAKAEVKEAAMVLRMTPHTARHAFVRTNEKFQDFIYEVEFQRDRRLDSGVMFRAEDAPDSAFSGLFGYMVKLDPKPDRLWTGGLFVDFGNSYGWLQTLEGNDPARRAEKPAGEWNHLRIEAIGEEIKIWLNGVPTVHVRDEKYRAGYFAFKIHFLNNDGAALKELALAYRHMRVITDHPETYATPTTLPLKDTHGELKLTTFR
jgi:hypothetical protein